MSRLIYVTFPSNHEKRYSYLCDFPCAVGDTAIVDTHSGLCKTTIVALGPISAASGLSSYKYVTAVTRKTRSEKAKLARESRRGEVMIELDALLKDFNIIQRYEQLAKASPAARRLLKELKDLIQ